MTLQAESQARGHSAQVVSPMDWTPHLFERAAETARIGMWSCTLPNDALSWTDQVYTMFGMTAGSTLDRASILTLYAERSLRALVACRDRALSEGTGFTLDAAITTPTRSNRWIRITAAVERPRDASPLRIFGMKQDITEEKLLYDGARYRADFDVMTGLANRSAFEATFAAWGRDGDDPLAALLLIDLDRFKTINDTYGHAAGDACLTEAAARIRQACRAEDFVARIGGDEFAVLLRGVRNKRQVARVAARLVARLAAPMQLGGCAVVVGASVGIARVETCAPVDLFATADAALYVAKATGRNTFRGGGSTDAERPHAMAMLPARV